MRNLFGTPRFAQAPADAAAGAGGGDAAAAAAAAAAVAAAAGAGTGDDDATKAAAAAAAAQKDGAGARKSALTAGAEAGAKGAKDSDADAAAAAKAKADGADAPLEVKLPEGTVVDKGTLDAYAKEAKAAGLNSEQASKLATWYAGVEKTRASGWAKQSDDWYDALSKDPEFGGKNHAENLAAFQSAVKRFGGDALVKDLERFGIDNMPSLVKAFAAIGKATGEQKGAIVETRVVPKQTPEEERLAKRYPSLAQKQA
jgi:hypothetical protein